MTTNTISLANNTADIEITANGQTYGLILAEGSTITEARGSSFAGQVSSGAPTYQDAAPYQRMAFESFGGGFGQLQYNRVFGGTGQGGDPTRYFYSDGWTLNGSVLMPGMARNLVQLGSGPGPAQSAEIGIPRGLIPTPVTASPSIKLIPTRTITADSIRLLVKMSQRANGSNVPIVQIKDFFAGTTLATWTTAVSAYNTTRAGWQWVGVKGGGTLTLNSGTTYQIIIGGSASTIGCYYNSNSSAGGPGLLPYLMITSSGADFYSYSGTIVKVEKVNNGGTTVPIVITGISMFANPIGGSSTSERALAGSGYTGSIVFDNKLYIGQGASGVGIWDAASAASAAAPNTNTNVALGPCCYHAGQIYFIPSNSPNQVATYDGGIASSPPVIIASNTVGKASSNSQNNITNICIYRGLMYLFKPEGIYQVYDDPAKITTANPPRIYQIVNFGDYEHPDNCKWLVEHQGVLFFNVRNMVYRLDMSQGVSQISVLVPPWPLTSPKYFSYVNGLASDGQILYMSYANQGIVAFNGSGYHLVTEFYNLFLANGLGSGLKVIIDGGSATGPNYLYCGDNQHLLQIPIPNYNAALGQQLTLQNQNKCFVWASSVWDADLAEIQKNIKSVILRAFPPYDETQNPAPKWNFKLVMGFFTPNGSSAVNYRGLIENTINNGIVYDRWLFPTSTSFNQGPAFWTQDDFANQSALSEKPASSDETGFPIDVVSGCFVLYGYNPTGSQYTGTYANTDITYVDSIIIKHLPIIDYLARYQLTLDLDALTTDANPMNGAAFQTAEDWLRTGANLKSPVVFAFKDVTGRVRTTNCILEQFRTEYEGATTSETVGDQPPRKAYLSLIATNPG